ncbi:MAG: glycosyltransferase family 4 protein [bacterium]|nr:glycosyltransferase family 4 protein [bacterium]
MKILFITDNFPPEVNAPATRTYEHCKEWIKQGAEITVITCAPNFPRGKVFPGYRNRLRQVEYMEGIRVVRVWSYMAPNKGFFKRILDYTSFAFSAFWAGLRVKTDIIIATSPQFFTTNTGYLLSRVKRVPWIFELRDLWPESIRAVGAMKTSRVLDFFEKMELFLYRKSTMVIAVTEAFKRNLEKRGIPAEKVRVVTNGSNLGIFTPGEKNRELLQKLGLENKFIVGYIGTHGMAHALDFIIDAIDSIELSGDPEIHFLFIGDGAQKEEVAAEAERRGLRNVTFLDPVSKEEVAGYVSILDCSLVNLKRSDTFKTVIPSKIFEASAMEKPVLLGVEGEAARIVQHYTAGLCYEPENREDFIRTVKQVKADKKLYRKLQKGCGKLARDYDREQLAAKMYRYIEEAAGKGSQPLTPDP